MTPPPPTYRNTLSWAAFLLVVAAANFFVAYLLRAEVPALWWLSALYAWSGLSLVAVAALYALVARGHNPGPVLKGWRHPWLQPALLPFRGVSLVVYRTARRLRSDPFSRIADHLFLGARPLPHEARALEALGVRALLDLVSEIPSSPVYAQSPFQRLEVPALDRTMPTDEELDRAVAWVVERVQRGEGVLVHCAFGRGRSALLTCAVVVALGHARTAEEALAFVARGRPSVRLKNDQFVHLQRFVHRASQA